MPEKKARLHQRYEHRLSVLVIAGDSEQQGETLNLSLGGAFVEVEHPPAFGSSVVLRMKLPALDETSDVEATVRWTRPSGVGVQFGSLRAKEVWALNQLLRNAS